MNPFAAVIRQYETHRLLAAPTGPRDTPFTQLDLDAIIVPASRPATHLDHAVTLARAAGCWLLVLCSKRCRGSEVSEFLAVRSYYKTIVIDLPPGYSHELLHFPALLALQDELPEACGYVVTDLSMKRNLGLVLARMLGWRRVFFLDDDIRDIAYPDLQTTVNMLSSFSAAGLWVTDFPDNSIACHANRMTDRNQDVFVSGAALAVDCDADIGFFPDIYNEDWLFFFDDVSRGRLANSCLLATQLCYYPFARAQRAAWQEFGDVLAEGLYALLHLGLGWEQATCEYWTQFLEVRRSFLEGIITRWQNVHPEMQAEMLVSVYSALKCLLSIKPDVCERYVRHWRQDLADWRQRAAGIEKVPSVEAALAKMHLVSWASVGSTAKVTYRPEELTPNVTAGAVGLPQFDTLKDLSELASALGLGSTAAADIQTIWINGVGDSQSSGPDGHERRWTQALRIPRLWTKSSRRALVLVGKAERETEPVEDCPIAEPVQLKIEDVAERQTDGSPGLTPVGLGLWE